jgi:hypothetical protein
VELTVKEISRSATEIFLHRGASVLDVFIERSVGIFGLLAAVGSGTLFDICGANVGVSTIEIFGTDVGVVVVELSISILGAGSDPDGDVVEFAPH